MINSAWVFPEAGLSIVPSVPGEGCKEFLRKGMKKTLHILMAEEEEIPFIDGKCRISTGRDLRRVMPFHNYLYFCSLELESSTSGGRGALKDEKTPKQRGRELFFLKKKKKLIVSLRLFVVI